LDLFSTQIETITLGVTLTANTKLSFVGRLCSWSLALLGLVEFPGPMVWVLGAVRDACGATGC
jgi:hypothetical protein